MDGEMKVVTNQCYYLFIYFLYFDIDIVGFI